MSLFTVLGAGGFVGSHLVSRLVAQGHDVQAVARGGDVHGETGHVVYCVGLTSDFRERPFETVNAHVCMLHVLLRSLRFASFTYLSSTRVYQHSPAGKIATEEEDLTINPNRPSDLYNLSKLMGESLCLAHPNPAVRAVRLSNVYGGGDRSENFLTSLLRDAIGRGHVRLQSPPDAAKDYIAIDDVLLTLERLPTQARSRLINVAAGHNVSNAEVLDLLQLHVGCTVEALSSDVAGAVFPRISTDRLREEIGVTPRRLADGFEQLVAEFRQNLERDDPVGKGRSPGFRLQGPGRTHDRH